MRNATALLLVLLTLSGLTQSVAANERDEKTNQIYELSRDKSADAVSALMEHLQDDDFHVALLAAFALAAKGDAGGLPLLKAAAKKKAGELQGFFAPVAVDDPRCGAIMAVEELEPESALDLYTTYLDNLHGIHQRLAQRRWSGKYLPFGLDVAVSRANRLATNEQQNALVDRFARRFDANPTDSDTAYVLAELLATQGQSEKARGIRLLEIRNTAHSAEEATIRKLDFDVESRSHQNGQTYRETVASMLNAYRDLLKLEAPQVDALALRQKAKPFLGTWSFDSLGQFREIVKFKIAGSLPREEALAAYKEIFALNPKAEYGGSLVTILNEVFREVDGARTAEQRRTSHRKTVKMYAEALGKSPEDQQLRVLYLRSVLAAEMADEAKRLITEMMQSPDWRTRAEPTHWLASYYRLEDGNRAPEAVALLAELLTDKHPHVRQRAAFELGQLHKPPELAAIALQMATRDPDPEVRREAAQALTNIGWDAANKAGS